jgi:hypothetical protein
MEGDGVRTFFEGKRGRRRGGTKMLEKYDITKSGAAT